MTGKKLTKFFYYLRNVTERTILTGTFSPFNFPACQRGILLRIPIASLLRLLSTPLSPLTWLILPSLFTTKEQVTLPLTPFLYTSSGYLRAELM